MKFQSRTIENIRRLKAFLSELGLEPIHLFVPSLLALVAALFEGITFALLAPTIRGLMESDFQFVYSIKVLGPIISAFPNIFSGRSSAIFIFLVTLVLVFSILKNTLAYLSSILTAIKVRRFSHELRCLIFNSYVGFQKSFFDKNSAGHLQNVLIGYTEQIAEQFRGMQTALYCFFSFLAYFIVMFLISWKATLFTLLAFPILVVLFQKLVGQIREGSKRYSAAFSLLGKKISNALACIPLVKASCSEGREKNWFSHTSQQVRASQVSMDKRLLLIGPVQEVFFLVMILLLVGFVAYLVVSQKEGNLSSYLVFFVLIRRALGNVGMLINLRGSIATVLGPLSQVMNVFEARNIHAEKTGVLPLLKFKDKIEFRALTFRYHDRDVLANLNFEIKKGQMVAIIGSTGSGKSTVAQLLMRFYDPAPGMLLIDGQDICHYQTAALRRKIAFISQDNYFFDASIEINLKYGCVGDRSAEEVRDAIEKAQLTALIERLPKGLATEIGERGVQLSGGEKQRLSLARAILRNPEILILDEATSAMDSQTERLVQAAITEAAKGRTSIVIAHRLTTIQKADLILVLEHGRLVESGSFSDLMATGNHFKVFWASQSEDKTS